MAAAQQLARAAQEVHLFAKFARTAGCSPMASGTSRWEEPTRPAGDADGAAGVGFHLRRRMSAQYAGRERSQKGSPRWCDGGARSIRAILPIPGAISAHSFRGWTTWQQNARRGEPPSDMPPILAGANR